MYAVKTQTLQDTSGKTHSVHACNKDERHTDIEVIKVGKAF
jgi:hypothetical protein